VNTSAPLSADMGRERVLGWQTKLHRWTGEDDQKRFADLFNLVCDPATLLVAWERVKRNRGSRTAGVDGVTRARIEQQGVEQFLGELRQSLKDRTYTPLPVREHVIPKRGSGKVRKLGIPALADRVVQMALVLVLEPIFEADFCPTSYGFRPGRRAQDAIEQVRFFVNAPRSYEWVVEGDVKDCFGSIHHGLLMVELRRRVTDKRVLGLIRSFLGAGIMREHEPVAATPSATPQGGVLSPLLANVALSVLDRRFEKAWAARTHNQRTRDRANGLPSYRMVRPGRTPLAYSFPSDRALREVTYRIKQLTRRNTTNLSLDELIHALNPTLRGWTNYHRHAASKRCFAYVSYYLWWRVMRWLRTKHPRLTWKQIRRR